MKVDKLSKEQLKDLAEQIGRDQAKASPAERRVKFSENFESAVKKMAQTLPLEKADK
jgi:hypothetical protein